jgi:hypothetical protein
VDKRKVIFAGDVVPALIGCLKKTNNKQFDILCLKCMAELVCSPQLNLNTPAISGFGPLLGGIDALEFLWLKRMSTLNE